MTEGPGPDPFVAQLADLCRAYPTRAKWVIVSSHAVGHALGERLAREGTNWANLRFETPFDLALQIAAPFLVERGVDPLGDELGPALIMRLLAGLPSGTEPYFRNLETHPQMGTALWSSIRELRLAGIGTRDLPAEAFANTAKHAELQALIAAYESWLASAHKADPAAVYAEARLHMDAAPIKPTDLRLEQPNLVWPPLVRRFLDALPGERLVPAVPHIPGLPVPRRLQSLPRDERETWSPLAGLMRPDVAIVGSNGGRPRPKLDFFRAGGAEAEIEEVFRLILHAEGGPLPLDEVEIACASTDYPFLIWQKAQRYGWPVTLGPGVPITATRPTRALLAWCTWVEAGYPAAGLRFLLLSGDIHLDIPDGPASGQAAQLLAAAEPTWGRSTYAECLADLAASDRDKAKAANLDEKSRDWRLRRAARAERLAAWIDTLLAPLPERRAREASLSATVGAARTFVTEHAAKRGDLDREAAATLDAALSNLLVLGDLSCEPAYALDLIRASILGLTVDAQRAKPGHLHVSLLKGAGYAGRRHTFVVGLEEGGVFPSLIEDPVLLDRERRHQAIGLPTAEARAEESVHAIVSRLAVLPQAWFSYSCRNMRENRETFPSWLMLQAFRLSNGRPDANYEDLVLADALREPVSVVPRDPANALADDRWWLAALRQMGSPNPDPVFSAFPAIRQGTVAAATRESSDFTIYDGLVPGAGADLDPRESGDEISPTDLESVARCPFRYLLKKGLGLRPIKLADPPAGMWLDPLQRGSLLHDLFAEMMRELRERHETASVKKHLAWFQTRARETLNEWALAMPPPSDDVFNHEREAILRDLEVFLKLEEAAARAGVQPVAFEVAFGTPRGHDKPADEPIGQPEPVTIGSGKAAFLLSGRFDRVDRMPDGSYEVVDYKTGSFYRPSADSAFEGGKLLQHALYSIAAEHLLRSRLDPRARVVAGRYEYPTVKGTGEPRRIPRPSAAALDSVLGDLLDGVRAGAFVGADNEWVCDNCEFRAACGPHPSEDAVRKIKEGPSDALASFRKLREHE